MARTHVGRHRAPGFSPLNELADIAAKSAQPAVKVSAVAVASGGLVAAFAIPASATQSQDSAAGSTTVAGAVAEVAASPAVSVAAPAVDQAYVPAFGVVGFTSKAAATQAPAPVQITKIEAPAPVQAAAPARVATPAPAATTQVSRSTTRTTPAPVATPAPAPAAKAAPAAPAAPAPTGGIIGIAANLSTMGIPYVYGGTTTAGFDCSGFTSYVYRLAGKSIPRTAEAQRAAATKVSNPAPGDLVFFGAPAYHVAIFAGGNQIYEAAHSGTLVGLHTLWTQSNLSYGRF